MLDKIKKKVINILDLSSDRLPFGFFAAIVVITSITTKRMGFNSIIILLVTVSVLMLLATITQIMRHDRNKRNILIYFGATLACIIMTITAERLEYYLRIGDSIMFANIIKIFLSGLAIVADIIGIFQIKNKINSKGKKLTLIIIMIYFSMIAILAIVFLPPKNI
ncbi:MULTISPECIES: hypothetical protein [unclassified Clostridium]|uniref:hypothetical protein n=1 Tax=unclassified Clostridium TaxID=2614128 RepID=UPI001EEDADC1|nr:MULTISPECIES: hypothetical protein [unclassified Clostridium]